MARYCTPLGCGPSTRLVLQIFHPAGVDWNFFTSSEVVGISTTYVLERRNGVWWVAAGQNTPTKAESRFQKSRRFQTASHFRPSPGSNSSIEFPSGSSN